MTWRELVDSTLRTQDGTHLVAELQRACLDSGRHTLLNDLNSELNAIGNPISADQLMVVAEAGSMAGGLRDLGLATWETRELDAVTVGILEQALEAGADDARGPLGEALLRTGRDVDRAIRLLREEAELDSPRGAYAAGYLGCHLREHGDSGPETEHLLRRAYSIDPFFGIDLAILLTETGRPQEALTILRSPDLLNDPAAHVPAGNALAALGLNEEAELEYRKGIAKGDAYSGYNLAVDLQAQESRRAEAARLMEWASAHGDEKATSFLVDSTPDEPT